MRQLIAGNWKMNGLSAQLPEIGAISGSVDLSRRLADVMICVPATLIERAARIAAGRISIGGENCHAEIAGPFTGDVSAEMLKDAGATAVIFGHSERRQNHGETDAAVLAKARAARRSGLLAIVCVGETRSQQSDGDALSVCGDQVARSVPEEATSSSIAIGYEPPWAIGTGLTMSLDQISDAHANIRRRLSTHLGSAGGKVRILYGGSVKPANAAQVLTAPHDGGVLVGGASLKAADFVAVLRAATMAPQAA